MSRGLRRGPVVLVQTRWAAFVFFALACLLLHVVRAQTSCLEVDTLCFSYRPAVMRYSESTRPERASSPFLSRAASGDAQPHPAHPPHTLPSSFRASRTVFTPPCTCVFVLKSCELVSCARADVSGPSPPLRPPTPPAAPSACTPLSRASVSPKIPHSHAMATKDELSGHIGHLYVPLSFPPLPRWTHEEGRGGARRSTDLDAAPP